MSNALDFTGTLTVDLSVYSVTGTLNVQGRRVSGTLRFVDDETKTVAVNFLVAQGLTTFRTAAPMAFLTPDEDLVVVAAVQTASTTLDLDVVTVQVANEDCLINNLAGLFSLSLSSVVVEETVESVEDIVDEVVTVTRKTLQPVRVNEVGNKVDHFGQMVSMRRLPEEKNADYSARLSRSVAEPRGSTYAGLVWQTCEGLGLSVDKVLKVVRRSGISDPEKAVFSIEEDRAVIYSDWVPVEQQEPGVMPVIEQETELEGLTVGQLADWVNLSSLFRSELVGDGELDAKNLVVNSTNRLIQETLPPSEIMHTQEIPLRGSVLVSEASLKRETSEAERLRLGDYSVDYTAGRILPLFTPGSDVFVSYMSNTPSVDIYWSPVRVLDLTREGVQNIFFDQIEREFYRTERARYTNGLPLDAAFPVLREVMNGGEFPQFWGE